MIEFNERLRQMNEQQEQTNTIDETFFDYEINQIVDPDIKLFTSKMLTRLPRYFFEVPASSTGKYHPRYACTKGGLAKHTKAAVRIALELFRNETLSSYNQLEQDMIISALILHDGCKSGIVKQRYTITEHPLEVVKFIKQQDFFKGEGQENRETICELIETHMGQWTYDYRTKKNVLERPKTKMQKFVHLCDYLASRKCLEFNFEAGVSK